MHKLVDTPATRRRGEEIAAAIAARETPMTHRRGADVRDVQRAMDQAKEAKDEATDDAYYAAQEEFVEQQVQAKAAATRRRAELVDEAARSIPPMAPPVNEGEEAFVDPVTKRLVFKTGVTPKDTLEQGDVTAEATMFRRTSGRAVGPGAALTRDAGAAEAVRAVVKQAPPPAKVVPQKVVTSARAQAQAAAMAKDLEEF